MFSTVLCFSLWTFIHKLFITSTFPQLWPLCWEAWHSLSYMADVNIMFHFFVDICQCVPDHRCHCLVILHSGQECLLTEVPQRWCPAHNLTERTYMSGALGARSTKCHLSWYHIPCCSMLFRCCHASWWKWGGVPSCWGHAMTEAFGCWPFSAEGLAGLDSIIISIVSVIYIYIFFFYRRFSSESQE